MKYLCSELFTVDGDGFCCISEESSNADTTFLDRKEEEKGTSRTTSALSCFGRSRIVRGVVTRDSLLVLVSSWGSGER
jgi:hypothetical protein